MGSNGYSLQECGLQQWMNSDPTPEYACRTQELPGSQVVKFYANLTDQQYKNVKEDCQNRFGIYVSRDVQAPRMFDVTGYDAAMLEGQQVLGVFRRYDLQARRITSTRR